MKIRVRDMDYDAVMALPAEKHQKPVRPSRFLHSLVKLLAQSELKAVHFRVEKKGMERLGADEPALFLMNHSCFLDLKIAFELLYPRDFHIVCTSDGFVGKAFLMRALGCIPTRKFMTDLTLVRDMTCALRNLKSSVLMYPEASYSFDGTATSLPSSLGKCLKLLQVPVVMIRTEGAFGRDPLYNGLQLRKTEVSASMTYLLSPEDIAAMSVEELNAVLREQFTFDNFRWQQENGVVITEDFRADGLNRVLYKCPVCGCEGAMTGKGTTLTCGHCGRVWTLTEAGFLESGDDPVFTHVPDWYAWERDCVRRDILEGRYSLDIPVEIAMLVDTKSLYRVGSGRLRHGPEGFRLEGCGGRLTVTVPPENTYSLYADYYWYEIGDMICIGDDRALYYCFPEKGCDVAARTRLATEELYRLKQMNRKGR